MSKPKFFQAVLQEIEGDVLRIVNPRDTVSTMKDRMGTEDALCPECGHNHWWLLPKEGAAVRKGGKPYIECLNCGYTTHL